MHRFGRTQRALAASAVVACLVVSVAFAAAPSACGPDVQRFCPDVPAGAGHVLSCLEEHASQLTPECRTALEQTKQHADQPHPTRAAWIKPCRGDVHTLCKDAGAGANQIAVCLTQHSADLSAACKAAFGLTTK